MTTAAVGGIVPEFTQADRLRKAREMTGLDQSQFAAEMGVSRQTVSNYEQGNTKPRRIVLKAWALASNVALPWLEHGDPTPPPVGSPGGRITLPYFASKARQLVAA